MGYESDQQLLENIRTLAREEIEAEVAARVESEVMTQVEAYFKHTSVTEFFPDDDVMTGDDVDDKIQAAVTCAPPSEEVKNLTERVALLEEVLRGMSAVLRSL